MTAGTAPSFDRDPDAATDTRESAQPIDMSIRQRLRLWLGTWYQVVIAELLCVLERRSYSRAP